HPDSVGADRRHALLVISVDVETGKTVWERTAYEGTVYDNRHKRNTYASATPATDGQHVYVFFGSEGLYCYDFNGKLVWKAFPGKIASLGMGPGASPVLFENLVIVQCDDDMGERSFIAAFDKKTGREVWRTTRKVQASWSTPVLLKAADRTELVANGSELIISYDPATGKELWRAKGVESNAIHTPVIGQGLVFVTAGFPAKRTLAIKPGGSGDITGTSHMVWTYQKGTAYVPSGILYGGYLYLMSDKGVITCLEPSTGEVKYEGGRVPVPATFTASPVALDGKLLLTSEDGDTFVVRAGPTHEVLRTNSIGEPVYASPAIAQGRIFIRGERHLYSIG
ncbi:MAG: PQQ-binding-like beta-propeller repeat protein, partial [Acidimicrobiia bacterium]